MILWLKDHGNTQMRLNALELNPLMLIAHINQDHNVQTLDMFI